MPRRESRTEAFMRTLSEFLDARDARRDHEAKFGPSDCDNRRGLLGKEEDAHTALADAFFDATTDGA